MRPHTWPLGPPTRQLLDPVRRLLSRLPAPQRQPPPPPPLRIPPQRLPRARAGRAPPAAPAPAIGHLPLARLAAGGPRWGLASGEQGARRSLPRGTLPAGAPPLAMRQGCTPEGPPAPCRAAHKPWHEGQARLWSSEPQRAALAALLRRCPAPRCAGHRAARGPAAAAAAQGLPALRGEVEKEGVGGTGHQGQVPPALLRTPLWALPWPSSPASRPASRPPPPLPDVCPAD